MQQTHLQSLLTQFPFNSHFLGLAVSLQFSSLTCSITEALGTSDIGFFADWMLFLLPNRQSKSNKGNSEH